MNGGGSQAAGMHVTALGKRNQLFHIGAQGLGLGQGGGDASIEDEAACLVGEQSPAVRSIALKLGGFYTVSHDDIFLCVLVL